MGSPIRERRGRIDRAFAVATYLSSRATNYWHPALPCRPEIADALARALATPKSGSVGAASPLDWSAKAGYQGPVDAFGLPLDIRSGRVFAIDAAQFVLGLLDTGRVTEPAMRNQLAKGLLALAEETRHGLRFRCFTPAYGGVVPPGWRSAMAQGQIASALLRLGRLEEAEAAITEICADHDYTSEELGSPTLRECVHPYAGVVLNGHLLALLGVAEVAIARPALRAALEPFVQGLEEVADQFVTGSWSWYEIGGARRRSPASAFYHRLHAELLDIWATLTGSHRLAALAKTCRLTDTLPFRLAALGGRVT